MEKVMSLRLDKEELETIKGLSSIQNKDKSTVARELIVYGWTFYVLKQYKEGKISIGKAAKKLRISLTEFIELLAEFGIRTPLTYEEFLEGYENLKKFGK